MGEFMRKKKIYVLSNPLVGEDILPLKLLPKLQQLCKAFDFEILDPTEEIPSDINEELILIDTVIGIDKVTVFHDLNHFAFSPRVTVHDFDLPINLGILQKLKKIKNLTIIGVPTKGNLSKILNEVINTLYLQLTLRK